MTGVIPKPEALPVKLEAIPTFLQDLEHWVMWTYFWKPEDGKWAKVPYQTSNRPARSNDPTTWTTFDDVVDTLHNRPGVFSGIGIMLHPERSNLIGVDLDHCVEDGVIEPWAEEIIDLLDSYTEISPSGTGLRIFVRGTLPEGRRRAGNIEMYDRGRYLTVTGHTIRERQVQTRTGELAQLHTDTFDTPEPVHPPEANGFDWKPYEPDGGPLTDTEILDLCRSASNHAKFERLYTGETNGYKSASEADQALTNLLSFYTRDPNQIDRLFRGSGLMRDKWNRADYRQATINNALAKVTETYTPPGVTSVVKFEDSTRPKGSGVQVVERTPTIDILPGDTIFNVPPEPESIWGDGSVSLWSKGESLMIYSPTGIGKTTLAQRVVLASIGIGPPEVLGHPIQPLPDDVRVLYVASDRPRQAMRSMLRMVNEHEHRHILADRLRFATRHQVTVTTGNTNTFLEACEQADAQVIVIDSYKDVAGGPLMEERHAQPLVEAWQKCVANGVDHLGLHHARKANRDPDKAKKLPESTDEVYGSSMLANASGSILALSGVPNSGEFDVRQLKAPAEMIADLHVFADYTTATYTVRDHRSLYEFLERRTGQPVELKAIASYLTNTPVQQLEPKHVEHARREVKKLVERSDQISQVDGTGTHGKAAEYIHRYVQVMIPGDAK